MRELRGKKEKEQKKEEGVVKCGRIQGKNPKISKRSGSSVKSFVS